MALGVASQQLDLLDPVIRFCGEALLVNSIFMFLHEHREWRHQIGGVCIST